MKKNNEIKTEIRKNRNTIINNMKWEKLLTLAASYDVLGTVVCASALKYTDSSDLSIGLAVGAGTVGVLLAGYNFASLSKNNKCLNQNNIDLSKKLKKERHKSK